MSVWLQAHMALMMENTRKSILRQAHQISKAIHDVEEATSSVFGIILNHKMIKPATRASLIKFLQLLVAHHPSQRCQKGSVDILVNSDDLCPSEMMSVNNESSHSILQGPELLVDLQDHDYSLDMWSLGCMFAGMDLETSVYKSRCKFE